MVMGDVPPAYIDILSATNIKEVIESYISIMDDWIYNVMEGNSLEESYPVDVPPTKEYAIMLINRLNIIENEILPDFVV